MTEQEQAYIQGATQKVRDIIIKTALAGGGDPIHSSVYLNVQDGVINALVSTDGNGVSSFCTFTEDYLDEIEAEDDDGAEAIVNVADFLTYLDFASDGGTVRLSLRGHDTDRLASVMELTGALNTRVMLPVAETILKKVPTSLPDRFGDPDNEDIGPNDFVSKDKDKGAMPTNIYTTCEEIQKVIEVVDYDEETELYPISITDGCLQLDVGRQQERNAVWGDLDATDIETPADVQNFYDDGFTEVFDTLSGNVRIQTAPGGAPIVVVQDGFDGMTIRHVVGNIKA